MLLIRCPLFRMLTVDKSHCKLGASGGNDLEMEHEEKKECLKLSLRRNYIVNAEDILQDFTSLTWLCLSANALQHIPSTLSQLCNLKHLFISNNKIQRIENLDNCKQLESIDLRHNQLQEISGISHLSRLSSLSVSANNISDISLENFPPECGLVFLGLYGNDIADFHKIILIVERMSNLSKLFIGANPFCNSLPLKSTFNVSVSLKNQTNGAKRAKCHEEPLNLSEILLLLKAVCPSLCNVDNNVID